MSEETPAATPTVLQPMGPLVRDLFARFDAAGVSWAVLRNAEGLPDHTRHDIDLLTAPADVARAGRMVEEAASAHRWTQVAHLSKDRYDCYVLISPGDDPQFLPIDIVSTCDYRGQEYADAASALAGRRRTSGGVWTVPPGFEAAVCVVKELLPHGRLKENSRESVQSGAASDGEAFTRALSPRLGEALARELCEACANGQWDRVDALAGRVRSAVGGPSLARLPAFLWKNLLLHLRPPMSCFVVLLGPDGSGKTTIADELCRRMYHRPFKACHHLASNFRIVPQLKQIKILLGKLIGRKVKIEPPPPPGTKHSGMQPALPGWRASIYIVYYALDLALGRLRVRRMRGQSNLIVFARYFYDYYYQRGYARAPRWLLRAMEWIIAGPDLILYLDRDAEEIYAMKPELDVEEIRRQQGIIRELLAGRPNARVIDGRGGVDTTVRAAERAILERVLSR